MGFSQVAAKKDFFGIYTRERGIFRKTTTFQFKKKFKSPKSPKYGEKYGEPHKNLS